VTISLLPRGLFSLPAPLVVALTDDGGEPVALRASWVAGKVEVDFVSDLPAERVERHAARMLSLDVDGSGLAEVGERDPVVGRLLGEADGRRPVCFGTPFEAAVWAVLSQHVSMAQARRVKEAVASSLGTRIEIGGEEATAFPGPAALASLESFEGVWDSKLERIRALSAAAAAGDLDPGMLRGLSLDDALAHLQSLPGIGPFGAMLVLARGAGHPDVPPPTLAASAPPSPPPTAWRTSRARRGSRSSARPGAPTGRGSPGCCGTPADQPGRPPAPATRDQSGNGGHRHEQRPAPARASANSKASDPDAHIRSCTDPNFAERRWHSSSRPASRRDCARDVMQGRIRLTAGRMSRGSSSTSA
jgi:endonuclease III